MLHWLKRKLGITQLETQHQALFGKMTAHKRYVRDRMAELKEYTRVDADVGIRGNNTIILTGVFRGQAYVRFYDLGDGEFKELVHQLKHMKDHALVRHVDAPPSFRGVFEL